MSDFESIWELVADPEVVRFSSWRIDSRANTKKFVRKAITQARRIKRKKIRLIVENPAGDFIGYLFLHIRNIHIPVAEISYCLRKEYWGQGYGSESVQALLKYAFQKLKLHRVYARVDEKNVRSRKLLDRNGFSYEGKLRQDAMVKGRWRDSLVYSMLAGEYK